MRFARLYHIHPPHLAMIGLCMTVIGLLGIIPVLFSSNDSALAASGAAQSSSTPASSVVTPVQTTISQPEITTISGHPVRIEAPSVGVDLPVVDGFYDSSTSNWTLYPDKAQFATITAEPNDRANQTFIYGHATTQVFGKLLNMSIGDEVVVTTSNGYKFTYTLKETQVVSPDNTGILSYEGNPRLLLQTCVGTFSENRKFFILDFTKVDKI